MKNKNKIVTVLLTLLLGITFAVSTAPAVTAAAAGDMMRIADLADLLSDSEEAEISDQLDEISERQQVDVVVVTVDSLEGESVMDYADDFYDYNGYGFGAEDDGILFLLSMEERDWYISTSGFGVTAVTDAGRGYMAEKFLPYLSDGEYAEAFRIFAEQCDDYITQARTGAPYDVDNIPTEPFSHVGALMIAVVLGFVIALIATGIMRLGLHSVHSQPAADSYMKKSNLRLTREYELFLYKNVTRTEKPKESSSSSSSSSNSSSSNSRPRGSVTHTSSSGKKHGGGGGKF